MLRQALAMVLASAALLLTGCPRYPLNEAFWRYYVTKLDVAQIGQRADSLWDGQSWWFIEPLRRIQSTAEPEEHLVYNAADVNRPINLGHDTQVFRPPARPVSSNPQPALPIHHPYDGGYDPDDDPCKPKCSPPADGGPTFRQIGLFFLVDNEYAALIPNPLADEVSLVNDLNGIYRGTALITFNILSSTIDSPINPCLTARTSSPLLDQVLPCFAQLTGIDPGPNALIHLLSGKGLERDVIGLSWQPGTTALTATLDTVYGGWFVPDLPA